MPKAKAKQNTVASDDEYAPSTSQAGGGGGVSLTQVEKQLAGLSVEHRDTKVNQLVQYLLITDQKKIPIKKGDINKHVLKEHSKLFPFIMKEAERKLRDVFGIAVTEIPGKQKSYILVNLLENDSDQTHQEWSEEDNSRMGLLMFILGMIFMNGNVIQDSLMYHALKKVGVDIDQTHEVFGDVKKLLTQEFVRQGYINYQRQPTSDPPTFEYRWGERAKLETTKRNALDFVCQIYGRESEEWTSQMIDVVSSEQAEGGDGDDDMAMQ